MAWLKPKKSKRKIKLNKTFTPFFYFYHFKINRMKKSWIIVLLLALFTACSTKSTQKEDGEISGELIIFHAGSVTVPVKEIITEFNKEYPNIKVLSEISGSVECARKISDLNKPCDIFISADYRVIEKILYPDLADWLIQFASNEMVIAYNNKSLYANKITTNNWTNILTKPDVKIGRSDPNSDPCGYRTIHTILLSENYYKLPGLSFQILTPSKKNIRPKEVDLLALLETNNIDYLFIYKSVAIQHKLKYIQLPEDVNLSNPAFDDEYHQVFTNLKGKNPNENIEQRGESIVYGVTMPKNGKNRDAAIAFLTFLLNPEKGLKIFDKEGQKPIIKPIGLEFNKIPEEIKKMVNEK